MKHSINLRKIALLAGAALLSSSAMSMPLDWAVTKTETVKYSMQKAVTTEGATDLYQKLHAAAARVCMNAEISTADTFDSCVSSALDKAVLQVAIPTVSALHLQALAGAKKAVLETVASR